MAVIRVYENVREFKLSKSAIKKIKRRSGIPPSPAEQNVYSPLLSPQSYDNYGNHTPYGTQSSLSNDSSSGASTGAGDSGAGSLSSGV